jgi:hypothetical protein
MVDITYSVVGTNFHGITWPARWSLFREGGHMHLFPPVQIVAASGIVDTILRVINAKS